MCLVCEAYPLAVQGRAVGCASDESWDMSHLFRDRIAYAWPEGILSSPWVLLVSLSAELTSAVGHPSFSTAFFAFAYGVCIRRYVENRDKVWSSPPHTKSSHSRPSAKLSNAPHKHPA